MPSSPYTASDWGCLSLHCRILAPTWGIANKLPAPSGYANTSFIPGLENSHSWPHNISVGSEEAFLQICQSYPSHVKPETSWHQALNISLLDFGPHTSSRNVEKCCSSFCPFIFLKRQFYRDYMAHESDSRLGCVREINQWYHCFADWIHLLLCGGRHSRGIQGASPSAGFGDPLSCLHGVLQCQRTGHHSLPEGFECQDLQQVGQKQAPGRLSELLLAWSQQWVSIPSGFHDQSVAMGFPRCSSSKESTCQRRGQGLNPWSGKIPRAAEQLSPWATTPEPPSVQLMPRNKRCHHNEKPTHSDEDPVRPKHCFLCSSLFQSPFTFAPVLLLFSCSVVSCSLLTHGLQHTRLHHLLSTISWSLLKLMSVESVIPSNNLILCHSLLLLPLILPRIRFFPMNHLFESSGQSIVVSASASVLPMNIQGWLPLGLTGLISLLSKGLSDVFSSTKNWKHQLFSAQPPLWSNSHIHTWLL